VTTRIASVRQESLLARLPDAPSDGMRCVGGIKRTAESLVERGWARCVGEGVINGRRFYVRTVEGARMLANLRLGKGGGWMARRGPTMRRPGTSEVGPQREVIAEWRALGTMLAPPGFVLAGWDPGLRFVHPSQRSIELDERLAVHLHALLTRKGSP
jgi:hypothetical protein